MRPTLATRPPPRTVARPEVHLTQLLGLLIVRQLALLHGPVPVPDLSPRGR
ncbi:hypothetical protein ACFVGM_05850 [Kitasatospora purpeofusca]|uniref:hypothetical protein n=1 Tax=Kitasatospora purpeofusca TaxID=67352 RepID=UPI00368C1912